MKVEFFENEYGSDYQLVPETPEEVAKLVRISMNSKKEKPEISLYLPYDGPPKMNIWIKKLDKKKQTNSIRN